MKRTVAPERINGFSPRSTASAGPVALRCVRFRNGRFLALPSCSADQLVPYRLEVLEHRSTPFLLPLLRRPNAGADGLLLDASGLLPLTRRFSGPTLRSGLRRRMRAEAESVLAGVDAALAAAADLLLPESGFDLSPSSVFLSYRAEQVPESGFPAFSGTPDPNAPCRFDVHLAFVPCRIEAGTLPGREDLRRWFEARRLVPRRPRPLVRLSPSVSVRSPLTPGSPQPHRPRPSLLTILPWTVLLVEAAVISGSLWLEASGSRGVMPVLLCVLAVLDAGLLLHPASPLSLRRAGTAKNAPPRSTDRTEHLSTVGTVTKMGILSENEPGSFEEVEGRRWFVLVDEFTVGRDADRVDLVPDGAGVSRMHARIRRLGGSFTVEDCSTRNGTFLDDRRLDPGEERVLPERCTLRFAGTKFYFRVE